VLDAVDAGRRLYGNVRVARVYVCVRYGVVNVCDEFRKTVNLVDDSASAVLYRRLGLRSSGGLVPLSGWAASCST
jgi:hypothetical protein